MRGMSLLVDLALAFLQPPLQISLYTANNSSFHLPWDWWEDLE